MRCPYVSQVSCAQTLEEPCNSRHAFCPAGRQSERTYTRFEATATMRTSPLLLPLLIAFALGACSRPMPLGPGDTTGTGSTGGTGTGTGAGGDGDPVGPPAPPPIVSVDPTVYALTLSGSFTSTGTATGVLFL